MLNFSSTELIQYMLSYFLPFIRIGAALIIMPVFNSKAIPKRVRLLFAVLLTIGISASIQLIPASTVANIQLLVLSILVGKEILIGFMLGLIFRFVFETFVLAGQIIAMQAGLGFAAMVDPATRAQVPVVSQFYLMLVTLIFLLLNGHHMLITVIAQSFNALPVNTQISFAPPIWQVINFSGTMFSGAVLVALPAIISLLIVNLSFGVMTKSAPQLNIFAVGFPITLCIGLIIIYLTLSSVAEHLHQFVDQAMQTAQQLITS